MSSTYLERFAYRVDTIKQLDPNLCAALARHLVPDESVRLIVVAPRQNRLGRDDKRQSWRKALLAWRVTPAWVLVVTTRRLIVATIAQSIAEPLVTVVPTNALVWIEIGSVLLKGWLEYAWVDNQQMHHMEVYFNTVGDRLFAQVLHSVCSGLSGGIQIQGDTPEHNRGILRRLPFKFKNIIASFLLLPGERVESVVYQPTIWRARFSGFRRQQAAAKVLALTNMHLLVVEEERSNQETSHGFVARYYPRSRLLFAELQPSDGMLLLNLRAGLGQVCEAHVLQFEPAATTELEALLAGADGSDLPRAPANPWLEGDSSIR